MMDGFGGWGFGWLGMIFVWLVPAVLILIGIKYLASDGGDSGNSARRSSQTNSALTILEERYAKGEIDRDEFVQKRDDLLGK